MAHINFPSPLINLPNRIRSQPERIPKYKSILRYLPQLLKFLSLHSSSVCICTYIYFQLKFCHPSCMTSFAFILSQKILYSLFYESTKKRFTLSTSEHLRNKKRRDEEVGLCSETSTSSSSFSSFSQYYVDFYRQMLLWLKFLQFLLSTYGNVDDMFLTRQNQKEYE